MTGGQKGRRTDQVINGTMLDSIEPSIDARSLS